MGYLLGRSGFGYGGPAGPLADAEDDELGGLDGGDPDQNDEAAVVEIVLDHRVAETAADEEGFLLLGADQRAIEPDAGKEAVDGIDDRGPQFRPVGLHHEGL